MEDPADPACEAERDALADEAARLRRAVAELALLNEVAQALGEAEDLGAMLRVLVRRSLAAVGAEEGAIVLVEGDGPDAVAGRTLVRTRAFETDRSPIRPGGGVLGWMHVHRAPLLVDRPATDPRFSAGDWPEGVRSALAVPLVAGGRLTGTLALYNKRAGGPFDAGDARLLAILASQSAQAVERRRLEEDRRRAEAERARVTRAFGEHTAPSVVEAVLAAGDGVGAGRRQHVCVMFLDLRGFTALSERWAPEDVVGYLNEFFGVAVGEVVGRGGVVHQLLGDGFMALFGAPVPSTTDCASAVEAALAIVERVEAACAAGALPPTRVGLGLHAGEGVVGMVGPPAHREYKVTGDVVNVAARVETMNKRFGSRLLVTGAVWEGLGRRVGDALGEVALDGRARPVALYRLA